VRTEEPRYTYVLDSDSEVLKKRAYWHLVYDLRSVLQIRTVPKWLVYTAAATSPSSQLLEKLVEVKPLLSFFSIRDLHRQRWPGLTRSGLCVQAWGLLAGMDRNIREARTHVEFESEQWLDAFTMEMQLYVLFVRKLHSFAASRFVLLIRQRPHTYTHTGRTPIIYSLGQGLLDVGSSNGQEGGQSVAGVRRVVSAFTTALEAWFAAEPSSSPKTRVWSTPDGRTEETHVLEYDIATQRVSLHLPLHRALGGVLAESCKEWGTSVLGLLLAEEKTDRLLPFVSALLEGPLRAQVSHIPDWGWVVFNDFFLPSTGACGAGPEQPLGAQWASDGPQGVVASRERANVRAIRLRRCAHAELCHPVPLDRLRGRASLLRLLRHHHRPPVRPARFLQLDLIRPGRR